MSVKIKKITSCTPGGCRHKCIEYDAGKGIQTIIVHERQMQQRAEQETDPDATVVLRYVARKLAKGIDDWSQVINVELEPGERRTPLGSTLAIGAGTGV